MKEGTQHLPACVVMLAMIALAVPAVAGAEGPTDAATAAADTPAHRSRDLARKANEVAVHEAIDGVLADNRLDLDIRLVGRTSMKIARNRDRRARAR